MKKDFEKYLYDVGQNVSMTPLEKKAVFSRLKEVIETSRPKVASPYFYSFFQYQRIAAFAFMLVFLVGGVTSVGAERSFPGDALYPFKVGVNEEVRGWFSQTSIAKAEWSIRLAERRLYELESIEGNPELSSEAQKTLEETFARQVEKAEQNTREYEFENEKVETGSNLEEVSLFADSAPSEEYGENLSAVTFSQELSSLRSKSQVDDEEVNKDSKESNIQSEESYQNQISTQIDDLKERIRAVRKSLRNAKDIQQLDKGKILRLEARLLQVQKELIVLEKKERDSLVSQIDSITKRIFEIEDSLKDVISSKEKLEFGEVLGGSIEINKEGKDLNRKHEDKENALDDGVNTEEKMLEIKNNVLDR